MEKQCLIIMPISDQEGYAKGHFSRVYQYIIVPACRMAGFNPLRADSPAFNESVLDVMRAVVDSDIAICDLSAKNLNALYGYAMRQGLNLPVILIRDSKTKMMEWGEVEYDESLRIDTVQTEIETLGDALKNAFANKLETNSLLHRLGIGAAELAEKQSIPVEADATMVAEEEPAEKKEKSLPIISPLPDFVGDPITRQEEIDKLKVGDFLFHMNYGKGEIRAIRKMAKDKMADFRFETGTKILILITSGIFRKIKA